MKPKGSTLSQFESSPLEPRLYQGSGSPRPFRQVKRPLAAPKGSDLGAVVDNLLFSPWRPTGAAQCKGPHARGGHGRFSFRSFRSFRFWKTENCHTTWFQFSQLSRPPIGGAKTAKAGMGDQSLCKKGRRTAERTPNGGGRPVQLALGHCGAGRAPHPPAPRSNADCPPPGSGRVNVVDWHEPQRLIEST